MSEEKHDLPEADTQEQIVVVTDENGHEAYYREEMIIPLGKKNFALLVGIQECDCEDENCEHQADEDDEEDVFIARIDFDKNGEPVYLDPTDEEFAEVKEAYDKLMDEAGIE